MSDRRDRYRTEVSNDRLGAVMRPSGMPANVKHAAGARATPFYGWHLDFLRANTK